MGKRLFVGNLSFNSTEDSIQAVFDQGGWKTASISIVTDRETGRSRGFAFVEMTSEAEEKKPRSGGGGFGGGGGGGGGYGGRGGGGGGGGGGRRERW
jgi:hypothetical protein